MDNTFDVIAIVGGTDGVMAATQAARAERKTLPAEKNARPGARWRTCAIS